MRRGNAGRGHGGLEWESEKRERGREGGREGGKTKGQVP